MFQDQGKIKILQTTGQRVETTGQRLWTIDNGWTVEIIHKNGTREWVNETDLSDID